MTQTSFSKAACAAARSRVPPMMIVVSADRHRPNGLVGGVVLPAADQRVSQRVQMSAMDCLVGCCRHRADR